MNHFFAHKVWFNLRASLINKEKTSQLQQIIKLSTQIEVLVQQSNECLYLANSASLLKLVNTAKLTDLMCDELKVLG